ncbi:helix-turn-helix domain-containing protein [Anseongella ginsenosidimutans]|uniref:helix-turn-helix domain-containing protein n=1 Tax=Anseongella ginsenosidimutans TaxID=496056 RepID=UPI001CEF95DE|nr:helix-turn-helix transcriptional regulator [Anseongella ginsenosidimutans]
MIYELKTANLGIYDDKTAFTQYIIIVVIAIVPDHDRACQVLLKILANVNISLLLTKNVKYIVSNVIMDVMKTTGEILRESREKKGLLLRQVAALLDIDTAILSKVERGARKATKEQIIRLAGILDLKKDYLLIQYLSEKIAYELADEDVAAKTLKAAEKRVKYLKSKK